MLPEISLSDEAEKDIEEAYLWYENQKTGLGEDLITELEKSFKKIQQNPTVYRVRYKKKVRGFLTPVFPYLILYSIDTNIKIISVFHTHRQPKTLKKRVQKLN